jgi:hypothetical protein
VVAYKLEIQARLGQAELDRLVQKPATNQKSKHPRALSLAAHDASPTAPTPITCTDEFHLSRAVKTGRVLSAGNNTAETTWRDTAAACLQRQIITL